MKDDVEQTTHAFLKQQGRRKSQRKMKGGVNRGHQGECQNCMKFGKLKRNGILIRRSPSLRHRKQCFCYL